MTTIKFLARAVAGRASRIAVKAVSSQEILTAVRDSDGNLKLIGWLIPTDPTNQHLDRAASAQAGEVSEVALALVGRRAVTAVRDANGNLKLISWDVQLQMKSITRLSKISEGIDGAATNITIFTMDQGFFGKILITAVRDSDGNLRLISWRLRDDGSFERLGDSEQHKHQAGFVSLIASCPLSAQHLMTAVRDSHGNLKLIAWEVTGGGKTITRLVDSEQFRHQAGFVGEIAMAPAVGEFPGVLTAVRASEGTMKVIAWRFVPKTLLDRGGHHETGEASNIAIASTDGKHFLTSLQDGSGELTLIAFDAQGGGVSRTGEFRFPLHEGGPVTETAATGLGAGTNQIVIANVRGHFLNVATFQLSF